MNAMTPGKPRPARGGTTSPAPEEPRAAVRLTMDFDDDVPLDQLPDGGMAPETFSAAGRPPAGDPLARQQAAAGADVFQDPVATAAPPTPTPPSPDARTSHPAGKSAAAGSDLRAGIGSHDNPGRRSRGDEGDDSSGTAWSDDGPTIVSPRPGQTARPRPAAASAAGRMPGRISAITVTLSVELGRQQVALGDLMASAPGQFFTLDRLTSEPVDIMVNGQLFARGEVVVIGDQFGVRLSELMDPEG